MLASGGGGKPMAGRTGKNSPRATRSGNGIVAGGWQFGACDTRSGTLMTGRAASSETICNVRDTAVGIALKLTVTLHEAPPTNGRALPNLSKQLVMALNPDESV